MDEMISYEEAMFNATDLSNWSLEGAAHWLAVAREIRKGASMTAEGVQHPNPGDGPPPEAHVSSARIPMPVTTRDREAMEHTQRIEPKLRIPLPDAEATNVMGALRNCYKCGQVIAYDDTIPAWKHVTSGQRVCVHRDDDDTIVYAWPAEVSAG
jgi:hypothetical protein